MPVAAHIIAIALPNRPNWERIRIAGLCVALLAATVLMLAVVNQHYAINRWLVWRYGYYWVASAVWALSCLSAGCFILSRLRLLDRAGRDALVFAFPLGVFAFQLAIFLLGLLGLLKTPVFVALPVLFLASGHKFLRAAWVSLRARVRSWSTDSISIPHLLFIGLGAVALLLLYAQIISPEGFSYDARWYHLPLAQQYALDGQIRPFPQGWWLAAYPQLASYLYTWAFLLPLGIPFDHLELSAHLEFVIFLATLAGIPALVRRLVPGTSGRATWVAVFLFPGIFLYDSNLHAGADHVAAFWVIPILLALLQLARSWDTGSCFLVAVFVSGVALTKYSAFCVLPFSTAAVVVLAASLRWRARNGSAEAAPRVWPGLAVALGTALVLTSPHWLKNWLWYGDPLYPTLHRWLSVHPWNPDAAGSFSEYASMMSGAAAGWRGVRDAALSTLTFAFVPNDWTVLHGNVPVFGFLFTLSLLCLPFLRASRGLWTAYAAVMVSVFFWYLPHHQDRYLQILLPWMAACTASALTLIWKTRHTVVRVGAIALVASQVAWGLDVPFFPTHNLVGDSPLRETLKLAGSGHTNLPHRFRPYGTYGEIGEHLPRGANVLIHDSPLQLGVNARTVQDQWQGRISYARLLSPDAIYAELKELGVTHMMWQPQLSSPWNCLAHTLAFANFASNHGEARRDFGPFAVAALPAAPPPAALNDKVAMLTCGLTYTNGWYRLGALTVPARGGVAPSPEAPLGDVSAIVEEAGFLVVEPSCAPPLPEMVERSFHGAVTRNSLRLYVRRATEMRQPVSEEREQTSASVQTRRSGRAGPGRK